MNEGVVVQLAVLLASILLGLSGCTPAHADDPPSGSTTKPNAPKKDAPKKDPPKKAPKKDAPKKDAPKQEAPRREPPKKEPPADGSETKHPDKSGSSSAGDVPPRGYR